jgi:undecaprenyl-diphosphatase
MSEPEFPIDATAFEIVPGQGHLGPHVDAFDRRVDELLEHLRGHPLADLLFTNTTHIADFSLIWHGIGIVRGIAKGRPDQVIVLAALLGAESLIVNQGLKRLFGRKRPTDTGDERFTIREPLTSSFPSGHASAAAFAATTLIGWDGRRSIPLWGTIAATVALSRPYVRIHHASDIVGGVVVGTVMGLAAKRVFRRLGPG